MEKQKDSHENNLHHSAEVMR